MWASESWIWGKAPFTFLVCYLISQCCTPHFSIRTLFTVHFPTLVPWFIIIYLRYSLTFFVEQQHHWANIKYKGENNTYLKWKLCIMSSIKLCSVWIRLSSSVVSPPQYSSTSKYRISFTLFILRFGSLYFQLSFETLFSRARLFPVLCFYFIKRDFMRTATWHSYVYIWWSERAIFLFLVSSCSFLFRLKNKPKPNAFQQRKDANGKTFMNINSNKNVFRSNMGWDWLYALNCLWMIECL